MKNKLSIVADAVSQKRIERGLSIQQVAADTLLFERVIESIENGDERVAFWKVQTVLDYLGISIRILDFTEEKTGKIEEF